MWWTPAALVVVAALTPKTAEAVNGVRLGLAMPIVSHGDYGTHWIGSPFEISLNVMVSYFMLEELISLDLELSEGIRFNNPDPNVSGVQRTGTTLRPGARLHPSTLPLYFGVFFPFHLEPSPFVVGVRAPVGYELPVLIARWYIEVTADFPLGGEMGAPGAFQEQIFSLGSGLQLKF